MLKLDIQREIVGRITKSPQEEHEHLIAEGMRIYEDKVKKVIERVWEGIK